MNKFRLSFRTSHIKMDMCSYPFTLPNFERILLIDSGSAALHSPKILFAYRMFYPD
ncbi:hypothetical protein BANRA_04849 [Escherichia coli]|nr:hypothetical protein BANRA_04849 [Escherichia coli]